MTRNQDDDLHVLDCHHAEIRSVPVYGQFAVHKVWVDARGQGWTSRCGDAFENPYWPGQYTVELDKPLGPEVTRLNLSPWYERGAALPDNPLYAKQELRRRRRTNNYANRKTRK